MRGSGVGADIVSTGLEALGVGAVSISTSEASAVTASMRVLSAAGAVGTAGAGDAALDEAGLMSMLTGSGSV